MTKKALPEEKKYLCAAYANKDWKQLTRAVHKIKGTASYCVNPRLSQASLRLTSACKAKNVEAIKFHYENILDVLKKTVR
ncbi:Hpt domain-containing protein, partial [Acinetobacter baumannii]